MAEEAKKELYVGKQADAVQRGVSVHLSNMRAQDIVTALAIARERNPEVQKALDLLPVKS